MTEEEKKAIEIVKEIWQFTDYSTDKIALKVVLDLIEKLQKENEEKDKKILGRKFYEVDLNELLKENYIPKDKIRNFIEKHKDNFYDGTANGCDYIDYEVIKEFIEEE